MKARLLGKELDKKSTTSEGEERDNEPQPRKILLGVTGSVAAVKALQLFNQLRHGVDLEKRIDSSTSCSSPPPWVLNNEVKVIATEHAKQFIEIGFRRDLAALVVDETCTATTTAPDDRSTAKKDETSDDAQQQKKNRLKEELESAIQLFQENLYTDEDEWEGYEEVGRDPVLHIQLRSWADVIVVAPLDANTLAKLSNGLCDNLLSCVLRAVDFEKIAATKRIKKPLLLAPAMNTAMWDHPLTDQQLWALQRLYDPVFALTPPGPKQPENCPTRRRFHVLWPVEKRLACGDVGYGAMASPEDIARAVYKALD